MSVNLQWMTVGKRQDDGNTTRDTVIGCGGFTQRKLCVDNVY